MLRLCTKFGSNISYSPGHFHAFAPDVHLMTACELTFSLDFWSYGHLMAMLYLSTNFGADIFIQSGDKDTF